MRGNDEKEKTDMVHGRSGDAEVRELTRLINKQVLQGGDSEIIEIMLPQTTQHEKIGRRYVPTGCPNDWTVNNSGHKIDYLNHKLCPYPMMDVDFSQTNPDWYRNDVLQRTASELDIEQMRKDLQRFQDFICTVELTDYSDQRRKDVDVRSDVVHFVFPIPQPLQQIEVKFTEYEEAH